MAELTGAVGELRFTLEVTRKETGKVETVEMIGHILPSTEQSETEPQQPDPAPAAV
jgi:hypothetical protein